MILISAMFQLCSVVERKLNRNMKFFHKFLNLLYKALRENIQFRNQQTISPGADVLKIDKPSTNNSMIAITCT